MIARESAAIRGRLPAALAGLVVLVGSAGVVTADHGGRPIGSLLSCDRPVTPPRCSSVGDNHRHYVAFDATLTEGLASSLRDTMAEDYEPTDLSMFVQDEVTAVTDVIAFSEDYGDNGAAGWVYCPSDAPQGINALGHRWCRHQELRFNVDPRFDAFFADDASRDHITCHELGHTLGLRHWGNPPQSAEPTAETCLQVNNADGPTNLHQIDIDHINAYRYGPAPAHQHTMLDSAPMTPAPRARRFSWTPWLASLVSAVEVERYGSLPEMTSAADAVIRGRVVSVGPGRVFGGRSGSPLHYAAATVRVDELIAGSLPVEDTPQLTLEIPLFDGPRSASQLEAALPVEGVFFVRSKDASARAAGLPLAFQRGEAGFYRLVTLQAVLVNDAGRAASPDGDVAFLSAFRDGSFEAALRTVRAAAQPAALTPSPIGQDTPVEWSGQ